MLSGEINGNIQGAKVLFQKGEQDIEGEFTDLTHAELRVVGDASKQVLATLVKL